MVCDCGFCVGAVTNSVGTLLVDWVAKPVKREFDYARHFDENVGKLRDRKQEVAWARDRLQHETEEAQLVRLQQIEDDVTDSQSKADNILTHVEGLERRITENKRCCFSCCPNWWWRYRLSKKLEKKTLPDISDLLERMARFGEPGRVAYRDPSTIPTIEFLSSKDFMVSKSSKAAFDQIILALKDSDISMIALRGMRGVGKTTLVREIGIQAKKLDMFDKVVITTVSKTPNFKTIQDEIAKYLGFHMKDEQGRRSEQELWHRLQMEKRILIILDDVWAFINLKEDIGIPLGRDHKGCKILLTTYRQQVCQSMNCQNEIPLGCWDEEEAWALFETKANLKNSDDAIKKVATEVIKKCHGLPISIDTLGTALKGKTLPQWEATLRRLEANRLMEIEDVVQRNAHLCLEESFNYLNDTKTKKCFLLCSLFPEDFEIYVEDLVRYAWGLDVYNGIADSIEQVRSEVHAAMDTLKHSSLLLDCGKRSHVKMHDTVRDVALWIASNRNDIAFEIKSGVVETWPENECFDACTAISFMTSQIAELPDGLVCPNLRILLLGGVGSNSMGTASSFFQGMNTLQVCSLNERFISPHAFQFQTNLRTLHLESCNFSVLGQLKKLQVLSITWSDIEELPNEIGDLNDLRLLDLSNCQSLWRIPAHLVRRLSKLEELYLDGCGSIRWATDDTSEGGYASLSELNSLSKLIVLSLWVTSNQIPKDFVFQKLQRFDIRVKWDFRGERIRFKYWKRDFENRPISRSLEIEASELNAFQHLIGDAESLCLGNLNKKVEVWACNKSQVLFQSNEPNLRSVREMSKQQGPSHHVNLHRLKVVSIHNCNKLTYLFPTSVARSLGQLETLEICSCSGLKKINQKIEASNVSLRSLREVIVRECNNLTSLSSLSHGQVLENLTKLVIRNCSSLEYTFPCSMAEGLSQLKVVNLEDLPQLGKDRNDDIVLRLPSLQDFSVRNCPQLSTHIFTTSSNIQSSPGLRSIQRGPSRLVHLHNLKVLRIEGCSILTYLFPSSVANSLGQLKMLHIKDYSRLEEIIQKTEASNVSLQSLREVIVEGCDNLTSLSSLSHGQVLKSLTKLVIRNCSKLEDTFPFSMADQGLPKLNKVDLWELPELGRNGNDVVLELPSLHDLSVRNCGRLSSPIFITSSNTRGSLQLRGIQRINLHSLKFRCLFRASVARSLGQLETLEICHCSELEEIIEKTEASNVNLQSLREVIVQDCDKLTSLSSLSHGQILENLTTLVIRGCSRLEYTFPLSMAEGFSQLKMIKLFCLPQLKGMDGNDDIVLKQPSLQCLDVEYCPRLSTPVFNTLSKIQELRITTMKHSEDHLFDGGYNLSSLKELKLNGLSELQVIWKGLIQVVNFRNLIELSVGECKRLRYVFSRTIAGNLPQLSSLDIQDCKELQQIIGRDEESSSEDHHLQPPCFPNLTEINIAGCENLKSLFSVSTVASLSKLESLHVLEMSKLEHVFEEEYAANVSMADEDKVIKLPRLVKLILRDLPKVVSFSPVGYHFIFPSLENIEAIRDCPNITTGFSVDPVGCWHAKTEASQ